MLLSINNASKHFNSLSSQIGLVIFYMTYVCLFRMCGQDRTQEGIWEDGCSCNGQGSGPAIEKVLIKDLF